MGIRPGEKAWQPLGTMFPDMARGPNRTPSPAIQSGSGGVAPLAQFTGPISDSIARISQTIFFAFGFMVLGLMFCISLFYFVSMWVAPSSVATAELDLLVLRTIARNAVIATFFGAAMASVALAFRFKRTAIANNGLRIALRLVFLTIALFGFIQINYVTFSYLSSLLSPAIDTTPQGLQILSFSVTFSILSLAVVHFPVGMGVFLLGLSGNLMANRERNRDKSPSFLSRFV